MKNQQLFTKTHH